MKIKKAKPRWSLPSELEFWLEEDILAERKEWQKALDKEKARADVAKKTAQEFEEHYIDRGIELEKAEAKLKTTAKEVEGITDDINDTHENNLIKQRFRTLAKTMREAKSND